MQAWCVSLRESLAVLETHMDSHVIRIGCEHGTITQQLAAASRGHVSPAGAAVLHYLLRVSAAARLDRHGELGAIVVDAQVDLHLGQGAHGVSDATHDRYCRDSSRPDEYDRHTPQRCSTAPPCL